MFVVQLNWWLFWGFSLMVVLGFCLSCGDATRLPSQVRVFVLLNSFLMLTDPQSVCNTPINVPGTYILTFIIRDNRVS